ncbi:MAG: spondin domain-containing protein [Paracoccaceae bacterium]
MTDIRITVRNTSETGGTALTPFYFGFHDGSFDLFNVGEAASPGLESLAEDGNFGPTAAGRLAVVPDSQGLVVAGAAGPIPAQEVTSNTITLDAVNTQVSFGAMILPSNDAFVGTDDALTLFDETGSFVGAQTVTFAGTDVYDAGTEVNTELDAAFINQTGPNTGVTEGGTIQLHQGFNGSAGAPVNILGGTTAPGAVIDPVVGDFTHNGGQEQLLEIEVTAVQLEDGTYDVTVTVTNNLSEGGTFLTPVWFGFHDGANFDLYDRGGPVSAGLESLAEDGAIDTIDAEFGAAAGQNGVSSVVLGDTGVGGPIDPSETASTTINVDPTLVGQGFFTWASMVIPSNDAFLASPGNPLTDAIFDADGNFTPLTITRTGADVLDAGTEVNTETDAAFLNQTAANTGVDQDGVVNQHQGFNGSEGAPIEILGGTNAFGQFIDPEVADFTLPGAQIAEVHINTVVTIDGTSGRDKIISGADDDIISTDDGRDVILSGDGYDVIDAGAGRDIVLSGNGDDEVFGGSGNDFILGGSGRDSIDGGSGRDRIDGGADADDIAGGDDRDALFGGAGDDSIDGGAGRDFIFGGSGFNVLAGGTGNDRLFGGADEDHFVFNDGDGRDLVIGYDAGTDLLVLFDSGFSSAQEIIDAGRETGGGIRLNLGDGDTIQLLGVSGDDLSEEDFLFV